MNIARYFTISEPERLALYEEGRDRKSLEKASLEKDLFVCYFLHRAFACAGVGEHLTFKGGTSLSKAHAITDRFSEDVDLVVDRNALGLPEDGIPGPQHSARQQKERAKKIAKACYAWAADVMIPKLREAMGADLAGRNWAFTIAPDNDNHETNISFDFPRLFDAGSYLLPNVKVDLVAKADIWPSQPMPIRSYLHELFPDALGEGSFMANTLHAERTMLEKALLLHEVLIQRPEGPRSRLARHYYDLFFLLRAGIDQLAKKDVGLYQAIVQQRSIYYRYSGVDYDALLQDGFTIIPQGAAHDAWHHDYDGMSRDMFYGEVPAFNDVMTAMEQFEQEFRLWLKGLSYV